MDFINKRGDVKKHLMAALLILFSILRIINYFYSVHPLQAICVGILLVLMLMTLPTLKRSAQFVLVAMACVGSFLLIRAGVDYTVWISAVLKNGDILLLLICVPMISAPFYYEDYQLELKHLAQVRMRSILSFLLLTMVFQHFLGVILSIGSIIIVYELLAPFAKLYKGDDPFFKCVYRSYCSAGFWSPAWASVIVYSALPEVKWTTMIPVGLGLAFLMCGMQFFNVWFETKRHPDRYPDIEPDADVTVDMRRIYKMLAIFILMILAIVGVNRFTGWDLMLSVTVVALIFPLVVALIQKKRTAYQVQMKRFYNVQLVKVRSQVAVFTMAGFLGKALSVAGVGEWLAKLLPDWLVAYPPLMVACVILFLILPTFVGVHPSAPGSALVAAITPSVIGLTSYTFAMAVIMGWLLGTLMGPFSAVGLLLSANTGKNNYKLTIGENWKFCLVSVVVFSLVISWIGPMLG